MKSVKKSKLGKVLKNTEICDDDNFHVNLLTIQQSCKQPTFFLSEAAAGSILVIQ